MDILIDCNHASGKFAIIIENKINDAKNQEKQLQRYVQTVLQRGFEAQQIYVFYLPLTSNKEPAPDDREALRKWGIKNYKKITFETHILKWLDSALGAEWPKSLPFGMRENLSHYRNLLSYLINQKKEHAMNENILKYLANAGAKNALPSWSQVEALQQSSAILRKCLESSLRGRLLLNIQDILKQKGENPWFFSEKATPPTNLSLNSEYDPLFEMDQNVCIRASDAVSVCFGGAPEETLGDRHIFWIGYLRNSNRENQDCCEPIVLQEANDRMTEPRSNSCWYAWDWMNEISYQDCSDVEVATSITGTILEMRNSLVELFRNGATRVD
jgi:hypothetical protein